MYGKYRLSFNNFAHNFKKISKKNCLPILLNVNTLSLFDSFSLLTITIVRNGAKKSQSEEYEQRGLRKLAQIEYDWLADMAERVFLGIFLAIFFLLTGGINVIGLALTSY